MRIRLRDWLNRSRPEKWALHVYALYRRDLQTLDEPLVGVFATESDVEGFIERCSGDGYEFRWEDVPVRDPAERTPTVGDVMFLVSDGGPSDTDEEVDTSPVGIAVFFDRTAAEEVARQEAQRSTAFDVRVRTVTLR